MAPLCLLASLGNDPHNQGLYKVARIAARVGLEARVLPPSATDQDILAELRAHDPAFLGLSYRLSPETGVREFERLLGRIAAAGLLRMRGSDRLRRVAVAGLPETMRAVDARRGELPCAVWLMPQYPDPLYGAGEVLRYFDVNEARASAILEELRVELSPPRIVEIDQLAREITATDDYKDEPPLPVPSAAARASYVARMDESPLPLLRTHFGIPAPTIEPTVRGIRKLANARVIDEVSLGSSDLSQRYFGKPDEFARRKNDGGVPYKDAADLRALADAAACGNFPTVKPYAHVVDLVDFVQTCVDCGLLRGGHQAVPLFWFNELDGRGPMPMGESIREHIAAVAALASHDLPVEMNDPNQWSSRGAHDALIAADYALITAVMLRAGVRDLVLQLQFNKPRETGDLADLAKMTAGLELAGALLPAAAAPARLYPETRTGIDSFDPDLDRARFQLARSTLLQLIVEPRVIHLVSYCEALHAATVEDVIDSSQLVRRCVRVFREHAPALRRYLADEVVVARRRHLLREATTLLRAIAALDGGAASTAQAPLPALLDRLASPRALLAAMDRGLLAAPGISHPRYNAGGRFVTAPGAHGFIDCYDASTGAPLCEADRLARL